MANNGYKQATVAYKTDQDGNPVDINGQLTSVSGRRQAIAVLQGRANPNPNLYEIEFYYNENALINGTPSITYDPVACPFGFIFVTPSAIILEPGETSKIFNLESSNSWRLETSPAGFVVDTDQGGGGTYEITVSTIGTPTPSSGVFRFINEVTGMVAELYVAYVTARPWVLEGGKWNNLGFWYNNETWNF